MRRLLLLGLLAAFGCSALPAKLPPAPDASYRWSSEGLEVSGVGKPDPSISNETQRRALAREAAFVMANARLRSYAESLRVRGRGKVGDLAAKDPAWAKRLQDALSRIVVVRTTWDEEGTAVVVIRAQTKALRRLKRP